MSVASLLVQAAGLRQRLAAADLAGQPAPAERAPDDRADALVERRAASAPTRSRGRPASSTPGARRSGPGRTSRRPPATSSGASRRSSSSRCSGSCRRGTRSSSVPQHLLDRRHARRSRAAGRGRCSRCRAARRLASTARIEVEARRADVVRARRRCGTSPWSR